MTPDDFRRLALAGLTTDQIALVMEIVQSAELSSRADAEAMIEASREKGRERWRKWDEKRRSNVGKHEQTLDGISKHSRGGDARVEVKTSNLDNNTEEKKETAQSAGASDLREFKSALSPSVDPERLESYVKHRKAKRGQLTGHAARLFLADAAACSMSPAEAVDACISRNWITVKPEYFAGRSRAPPSLQKPETTRDVGTRLLAEMRSANGQPGTSDSRHQRALVAIPGGRDTGTG